VERVRLVMADTDLVPDDGITAGSRTTPINVPEMRRAAATARALLTALAAREWKVDAATLEVRDGVVSSPTGRTMTYADLARVRDAAAILGQSIRPDVTLTPVREWKTLGQSVPRSDARDLVTGAHRFPSDVVRPGMLYGRVLRGPAYGATLESLDLSAAKAMKDVVAVREGSFVGFAAPSWPTAGRRPSSSAAAVSAPPVPSEPGSSPASTPGARPSARPTPSRT
jgi:isoquinoline 1-oxidoreductase subunit beta